MALIKHTSGYLRCTTLPYELTIYFFTSNSKNQGFATITVFDVHFFLCEKPKNLKLKYCLFTFNQNKMYVSSTLCVRKICLKFYFCSSYRQISLISSNNHVFLNYSYDKNCIVFK